jgi:hypothetical protein
MCPKTKSKFHFSCTKKLVAKQRCKKHSIKCVQLIQVLKPRGFSFTRSCTFGLQIKLIWTCYLQFAFATPMLMFILREFVQCGVLGI